MKPIVAPIEDHIRAAQQATVYGEQARMVLGVPAMREFFVQGSVDIYIGFLEADPGDLLVWQTKARALNQLYESLTLAVGRGDVAAERLAELAKESAK